MTINPQNIISLIQSHFSSYHQSLPIKYEEQILSQNFISIMEKCLENGTEFEVSDDLVIDDEAAELKEYEEEIGFEMTAFPKIVQIPAIS